MPHNPFTPAILKFDFFDTAVADIFRAIDGGALMGSFILSFCCIDYMGAAFDARNKSTRKDFKRFVREYMGAINSKYQSLDEEIYAIRNSLVHTYGHSDAIEKLDLSPSFSHLHPELHLTIQTTEYETRINLNLPEFVGELVSAIEKYFRENVGQDENSVIWKLKMFSVQNIEANNHRQSMLFAEKPLHSKSHRFFAILDEDPRPELQSVNLSIQNLIREKYNN